MTALVPQVFTTSPNAMLLVGRVVLGQLLQQRHLLLRSLAHGVVVTDHLQRHLRAPTRRRRASPSRRHKQTPGERPTNPVSQNFPQNFRGIAKKFGKSSSPAPGGTRSTTKAASRSRKAGGEGGDNRGES